MKQLKTAEAGGGGGNNHPHYFRHHSNEYKCVSSIVVLTKHKLFYLTYQTIKQKEQSKLKIENTRLSHQIRRQMTGQHEPV